MSTNKSSLIPVIIQCIGLFFTIITVFLGAYYALNGEIIISALISILIVTALFFLVDRLVKEKIKQKRNASVTKLFIFTYAVISIIASFFVLHCFNVEFNEKASIQALGNSKLTALNNMIIAYNDQGTEYRGKVQTDLTVLLIQYLSSSASKEKNLRNSITTCPYSVPYHTLRSFYDSFISQSAVINPVLQLIQSKLDITANEVTRNNKSHLEKYGNTFTNWYRLRLCQAFYETDELLRINYKKLYNSFDSNTCNQRKFSFNYPTQKPLINKPILLWHKHSPFVLVLVVVLYQLLILLPYLAATPYGNTEHVKRKDPFKKARKG